jgi:hypothetical protein
MLTGVMQMQRLDPVALEVLGADLEDLAEA